jgi:hypothetical protein
MGKLMNKINIKGFSSILIFSTMVITMGSFQFGYTIGVLNIPKEAISGLKKDTIQGNTTNITSTFFKNSCDSEEFFKPCVKMEPIEWNIFVSSFLVSSLIASNFL